MVCELYFKKKKKICKDTHNTHTLVGQRINRNYLLLELKQQQKNTDISFCDNPHNKVF